MKKHINRIINFLLILVLIPLHGILQSCLFSYDNTHGSFTSSRVVEQNAMVVTAHPLASRVGVDILKKGGNAVDAAIAVQFALAVVYPVAGNIGGGGFMVMRKNDGSVYSLDFREKAPLQAHKDMYIDSLGNVMNELSITGHLACGVPGTVDGMVTSHKEFGTLPWRDLLQPAINLASRGFPLTRREAIGLNHNRESFLRVNTSPPEWTQKENWEAGDTIAHSELAETLKRIQIEGREGFYGGETSHLIVAEMERGNGLISLEDLEAYRSVWREPVAGLYRDHKIISMGPPSSGGIALIQILKMLEQYDVRKMNLFSTEYIHLLTEAEKRVYADRAKHLGDADFYNVPVKQLLDSTYNISRMQDFTWVKATPAEEIAAGNIIWEESAETTHFSIIDSKGNAVAVTTTLNGAYGSKVFVEGTGFLLNNEMDDFSIKPGSPNMYGLVGGEANAIAPGKRMLSSMTPTIIEKNGRLFMVIGSPGGSRIITSVLQSILNVIDHDLNMQEAVNLKRFHHQWRPDFIVFESGRMNDEIKEALLVRGHRLKVSGPYSRVDAIRVLEDGTLESGADPRGDDTASGY